ncbi:MAG: phosphatase PAP2 family protein [bacterium]|nr:phosphatase PAP2 family protein [bacterium]
MKNFLKKLPIEIYAIAVPSFLMVLGYAFWAFNSTKQVSFITLVKKMNYLAVMGDAELNSVFIVLWVFVAIYIVMYPIFNFKKSVLRTSPIFSAIKSLIVINVFASVTAFVLGLTLTYLFYFVSGSRVFEFTILIDGLERAIFGGLPAIPLINFFSGTIVESVTLYTYLYFVVGFLIMLIVLAFFDKNIFRQTLIAFFLSSIISIPIFTALPVISPDGLYLTSVLKTDNVNLPELGNFMESPTFFSLNAFFHNAWISEDSSFYSVSSFPSLHTAWGLLAVLGIFKIRRRILSYIFAVWLFFNSLGTFYSLQHYALDTVAGLVFGLAMFYLAGRLMNLETKYYTGENWYSLCDFLVHLKKEVFKKFS